MTQIELLSFSMRKDAPKAGDDWFRIIVDKKNDIAKVYIYDEIGYWGTNAKDFASQLNDLDVGTIHLHINSPGGSVFDALAIGASIKEHKATVVGKVDGMAASAASFILQYCDTREISRNAQVMIHDASAYAGGNAQQMRKAADLLDRVSDNIADIYAVRSGQGDKASWRAIMVAGDEWYDGNEALAAGLVDVVTDNPEEEEDEVPDNSWTTEEINAFLIMPAATLAQDPKRSIITNRVEEALMSGTPAPATPPAVTQPPAVTTPEAVVTPPAPAPVAPVAPVAGLVDMVLNGTTIQVPQAVADRMTALETFQKETIEAGRNSFVEGLKASNKILATQEAELKEFAQDLSPEQFAKWKASYETAPAASLLAVHGVTPGETQAPSNGGAPDATAERIKVLEEIVDGHRAGGMDQATLESRASFKELQQLKSTTKTA